MNTLSGYNSLENDFADNQNIIGGSVATGGGDFTGRDKHIGGDVVSGDKIEITNFNHYYFHKVTRIVLTIQGELESFSQKDQERLTRIIAEALSMNEPVTINKIEPGSIKVTIELPTEKAIELYKLIKSGKLIESGVINAALISPYAPLPDQTQQNLTIISSEEYIQVRKYVNDGYKAWEKQPHPFRIDNLIGYELFTKIVNNYIQQLNDTDISKEQQAYLVRCAIQHGKSGRWDDWLLANLHNEKIVPPLVYTLTSKNGWRPAMRAAYILQTLFDKQLREVIAKVDTSLLSREDIKEILEIVEHGRGIVGYLQQIEQSVEHLRKHEAARTLEEITLFEKKIAQFNSAQSIADRWLKLINTSNPIGEE